MAITTVDQLVAGFMPQIWFQKSVSPTLVAGRPHSHFYDAGIPGAAAAPAPGMSGAALTSYEGQLPFTNPVSGNTYLSRFMAMTGQFGTMLLCDRLWHNSGINVTLTTAQTVNSVAWPARDGFGSTNGDDVLIGLEVSTATGAGASVPTISYTNQAGTAGRSAGLAYSYAASSAIGAFYPFALQAGDTGVRSVQSVTLGTAGMTSGAIHLVAFRILAQIDCGQGAGYQDAFTGGFPRLYDNTVPFLVFLPSTTTATRLMGQLQYAQG